MVIPYVSQIDTDNKNISIYVKDISYEVRTTTIKDAL